MNRISSDVWRQVEDRLAVNPPRPTPFVVKFISILLLIAMVFLPVVAILLELLL